jgi:mRNA interferase RelE/StbE
VSRYRVSIHRDALRALAKLDKPVRRRIQTASDRLADDRGPLACMPSRVRPGVLRLRVGDYRVIYQVHDLELLALVVDLARRTAVYRD